MQATSLLDLMRAPPVRRSVERDGPVVKEPKTLLSHYSRGTKCLWAYGEIQIHPHTDSAFMWATSWGISGHGSGYQVGAKWGKFAETHADALYWAAEELITALQRFPGDSDAVKILAWARGL